nr:hypothetical protein [Gammaproteobacteria bacterium]
MAKVKTPGFLDVMGNPFAFSDAGARAQAFWSAQSAAAEHVQSFTEGWCERRRDGAACCARINPDG